MIRRRPMYECMYVCVCVCVCVWRWLAVEQCCGISLEEHRTLEHVRKTHLGQVFKVSTKWSFRNRWIQQNPLKLTAASGSSSKPTFRNRLCHCPTACGSNNATVLADVCYATACVTQSSSSVHTDFSRAMSLEELGVFCNRPAGHQIKGTHVDCSQVSVPDFMKF